MDAEKIRKLPVIGIDTEVDGAAVEDAKCAMLAQGNAFLREIAAQLAELNSNLRVQTALKDCDPRFIDA